MLTYFQQTNFLHKKRTLLNLTIILKAFAAWFVILVLAIANGGLREAVLLPVLGKPWGFILSGLILSVLILVVAYFSLLWFGRVPVSNYLVIGMGWLFLTLVFEFVFGRFVAKKSWRELLEAYAFKDGNIWPIVLVIVALAPYLAAKFRGWV